MNNKKKVAIIGYTGLIGKIILTSLKKKNLILLNIIQKILKISKIKIS